MAYAFPGAAALDYSVCHYAGSRLLFRGPPRPLDRPYVAVLGGTESYGKFVTEPFTDLVQQGLGLNVVNLANVNAGVDLYLNERAVIEIALKAEAVVVQVTGAQNVSNRFYTVHPRRNDRLLGVTPEMRHLYSKVDFTEFNFTRHMVTSLFRQSAERFRPVAAELRKAWSDRMKMLLGQLPQRKILLWMADSPPPAEPLEGLGPDPLLVDATMLDALKPLVTAYVEITPSEAARAEGLSGKVFTQLEQAAALGVPGQGFHREVANQLTALLDKMM